MEWDSFLQTALVFLLFIYHQIVFHKDMNERFTLHLNKYFSN